MEGMAPITVNGAFKLTLWNLRDVFTATEPSSDATELSIVHTWTKNICGDGVCAPAELQENSAGETATTCAADCGAMFDGFCGGAGDRVRCLAAALSFWVACAPVPSRFVCLRELWLTSSIACSLARCIVANTRPSAGARSAQPRHVHVQECNGAGICVLPALDADADAKAVGAACDCFPGFEGATCNRCAAGYTPTLLGGCEPDVSTCQEEGAPGAEAPKYYNRYGDWSECADAAGEEVVCGGGTQSRSVECKRESDDSLASGARILLRVVLGRGAVQLRARAPLLATKGFDQIQAAVRSGTTAVLVARAVRNLHVCATCNGRT